MQEGAALRPLGVGDIVDRVFALYRSRPLLFLAVAAIPYLVLIPIRLALTARYAPTLAALATLRAGDIDAAVARLATLLSDIAGYGFLLSIATLAITLVQSGAIITAAAARYTGGEATAASALGAGLRAAPRLVVMAFIAVLGFCAVWVVAVVGMAFVREWWAILVGTLGAIVASFYLAASWMVAPAVSVLEGAGPVAALARSWRLSGGARWRILGLIVLLLILQIVLSLLLSSLLVATILADPQARAVMQQVVDILATIAWAPLYWGAFAVLYYDLRVRKEALDLELAAEALPRDT